MTEKPSDFVEIELSAAGVAFAGEGGAVRVANGHFCYEIAHKPVRVLKSEWSRSLSKELWEGKPIFQIAQGEEE